MLLENQNSSSRKLAAILFADIAGYTAMMQSDEGRTMHKLRHYQTVLKSEVAQHKGEIIKNYGDGSLCLFSSVLDAVHCAKSLQETFKSEPVIPLRIGLHLGDVMYEENDIYGNSINVASRIESMGIPGAVLMSKDIQKKINNQSNLSCQSLGTFEFKNVEEPVEVFALANEGMVVPKRDEMKGKLKDPKKTANRGLGFWLIPIVLIATAFGIYQWYQSNNTEIFQPEILKERIAVLPFKNNTNDPDLDILGDMAADWINQGLMDIGEAEVVSPYTVRAHIDAIGILENDLQNRPSFAELTGAQNLITGNFYKKNEELIFKLEIVDALEGNLRFGFKPIRGKTVDKEALIAKLREQVMGYWVARDMVDSKRIKPPNFKAYELYISEWQGEGSEKTLLEVLALDSTFYLARLDFLNSNRFGLFGDSKVQFDFLKRHQSNLSDYEKGWLNFAEGLYLGNPKLAFNSLNTIRKKYPKDPYLNHEAAAAALGGLNNPELTLAIYKELPIENIAPHRLGRYYNWRIINTITALIKLKEVKKATDFLKTVQSAQNYVNSIAALRAKLFVAMENKDEENIAATYDRISTSSSISPSYYLLAAFTIVESNLPTEQNKLIVISDLIGFYNQLDPNDINRVLWNNLFAWLEKKRENINTANLSQIPIAYQSSNLFYAGRLFIETGQIEKAHLIVKKLEKLTTPNYYITSAYGCALAYYRMASLQVQMGQYDNAIVNLSKARALGIHNPLSSFLYDNKLVPLYDLPEFQELLEPIWPDIKD